MANPLQPNKKTVDMATPGPRVSRIRRDPPPPVKPVNPVDIKERETWAIVIGIVTFALALSVILIGVSNVAGWSPRQYTIEIEGGL